MIQLELGSHRWPLPAGESVLGSSPAAAVRLEHSGVLERHALLRAANGGASIRPASSETVVLVNGVRLGADPVPLLHGDKIQVGVVELVVVDERQIGTTRMADASALRAATKPGTPMPQGGAMSGGRLVSLSDGREYQVGQGPLVFGRDASCDIVIESTDVSRRHAVIANTPAGYVLEDTSSNGVEVNGERAGERRTLTRGDVLKIGPAVFRFYSDPEQKQDSPPPGAAHRLFDTVHGIPAMVPAFPSRPTAPPPLATVLVRSGSLRGQRLPIRTPVVHIGRADYNDLVFGEESVSASHAKLQRREELWVLTDLDSTNGTFVDGDQVSGEVPLMPGSTVRFGDVTVMFDPTDLRAPQPVGGGTRVVGAISIPETPRIEVQRPSPPSAPSRPKRTRTRAPAQDPRTRWIAFVAALVAAAAAVAYYFFGR
ncbi:MAG: FHA domain-containing protein [Gemmatimonadales bacterium]|nr:MAG: FHA domain-containing protein [Gemmatimonadales bacterium]